VSGLAPFDDSHARDDHPVDRLLRSAAAQVDDLHWPLHAADVTGRATASRRRCWAQVQPSMRAVFAGVLLVVAVVLVFVAPLPQLHLFQHRPVNVPTPPARKTVALTCPATRAERAVTWVPARPVGVAATSQLVPEQPPSRALICAYGGDGLTALAGDKDLTQGLEALAGELAWLPPPEAIGCGGPGVAPLAPVAKDPFPAAYLIGLSYPDGELWVATSDNGETCPDTSNGAFTTSVGIGPQTRTAYGSGRWTDPYTPTSCANPGVGRLGQQGAMVPLGAVTLDICVPTGANRGWRDVRADPSELVELARLLDNEPSRTSTDGCSSNYVINYTYELIFRYLVGPPVVVEMSLGCSPPLDNGSLQVVEGSAVIDNVNAYLVQHHDPVAGQAT
jgi:hypothetical protein